MSFTQERCCVCLENKKFYTECKHCNDGKYCKKCIVKLIEENKNTTCCICRQETWYKDKDKDKMQLLINKHKKKVIGTSLDETIINVNVNNDQTIITDVLEQNDENYYIETNNVECYTIKQVYTIVLLSFITWAIIFGLFKDDLSSPDNYKYLPIILVSIIGGCSLFACLNYIKKHCDCGEFIFKTFCLTLLIVLGYVFTFILCELHTNYSINDKINYFIIIMISLASGIALAIATIVIIILNKKIYEILKEKCSNDVAECCCNPLCIMIHIMISIFLIQLGRIIMFDYIKIILDVNEEHRIFLEILISYVVGVSIFLIPISLFILVCFKDTRCKCKCKKETTSETSIGIEEIL